MFILLLFAITTYINLSLSEAVTENEDYYSRSTNVIRNSGMFQRNILIMVNGLPSYLFTAEKSFIETYNEANNENDSILKELTSQLTDSSQSQVLI
ncbi:MAG: hypothetical protein H7Z13_02060 [Ferruginibacter sp.]|nr:hypothetical protein [Ferruginibacter sp.]